jgi:hypothetical protein
MQIFACRMRGNATTIQEALCRCQRREETRSCVSWGSEGEGCDGKTPDNGLQTSYGWLPSMPKWYNKELADLLEA